MPIREDAGWHDEVKARRRYALFQASAILTAAEIRNKSEWTIRDMVDFAEALLAEIEKREKEK